MLPAGIIAFIVIYLLILCCYFYTETTGNLKLRAPNKFILAFMFLIFGLVYTFIDGTGLGVFGELSPLFAVALTLSALGDIFLLFSFSMGGGFFAGGNIAFIAFETSMLTYNHISINQYWWIFIVIILLWCIYPILSLIFPKAFNFGKYKMAMFFYLATIITNGSFGMVMGTFIPSLRVMGIGLFLFMLSDFDIVLHKFVWPKNKWVHRLNSALYFTGMLMVALNVAMLTL